MVASGVRRMADHPATRIVLLVLAGGQALIGAFVLGLAVNVGTSGVDDNDRPPPSVLLETPLPTGAITLDNAVVPGVRAVPASVAVAPDGNVWFTTSGLASGPGIGQIDRAGTIRFFAIPTPGDLAGIAIAPDGAVWFADQAAPAIGRRAASGTVARFPVGLGSPRAVATDREGNVWFTVGVAPSGDWIGRMTPDGGVTRFPLPTARADPQAIVAGPDGNMWFAMSGGIGRMTPAGVVTEVATTAFGVPAITAGRDGALWFSANGPRGEAMVGRISTDVRPQVTAIHRLPEHAAVQGIASGIDGNLWVGEHGISSVARITPGGQITQYGLGPDRFPTVMAAGRNGSVFVAVAGPNRPSGLTRFDVPRV